MPTLGPGIWREHRKILKNEKHKL